jgi:hypothetical protein
VHLAKLTINTNSLSRRLFLRISRYYGIILNLAVLEIISCYHHPADYEAAPSLLLEDIKRQSKGIKQSRGVKIHSREVE